jgi:hypothetical protein
MVFLNRKLLEAKPLAEKDLPKAEQKLGLDAPT